MGKERVDLAAGDSLSLSPCVSAVTAKGEHVRQECTADIVDATEHEEHAVQTSNSMISCVEALKQV